jgi:phenylacetate-CoA ligase
MGLRRRRTLAYLDDYQRDQWLAAGTDRGAAMGAAEALARTLLSRGALLPREWTELGITPQDIRSLDDYASCRC